MTIEEILKLEFAEAKKQLTSRTARTVEYSDCIAQYMVGKHSVFDEASRPKKEIQKPTGKKDSQGNVINETSYEEVNRIGIPNQKLIVKRRVGFLLGNPIKLDMTSGDEENQQHEMVFSTVKKIWTDNKLNYRNKELARLMFSECEVAELWYPVEVEQSFWKKIWKVITGAKGKYTYKMRIIAQSKGDTLFPLLDNTGDLIAFSREYTLDNNGKKEIYFETYTKNIIMKWVTIDGNTVPVEKYPSANPLGKIPVIFYQQEYPEWYDVQSEIDRLETLLSNFGDTNDYFGSPMMVAKGKVLGFASKGERGKAFQLEEGGSLDMLSWDSAPEAVALEIKTLKNEILSNTQTPDISFDNLKSIGNVSGIALKLMFIDAHMAVSDKEEVFGINIQRRLNLLRAMVGNVIDVSLKQACDEIDISPVFTPYLPKNVQEESTTVNDSYASGTISRETAVHKHPLVSNPVKELEQIKLEQSESIAQPYE
ncbi:MAG: phage portal protein [Bacteroidetes bacterium HGW-Bacteroidetes-4]|jgi:SPP1 family phage portal protein|nr:MAG: phage portal protein [Bacteroidetes bacterium HGW-Bacteroidetes-4]